MATTEEIVIAAMRKAKEPIRPGDIAKQTGLEAKDVSKTIDNLKKKGLVTSPKRCYYALK